MLAQFKVCATDLQGKVEPNKTLRLIEKKLDQFPLHAFDDPLRIVSSPLDQCHQFVGRSLRLILTGGIQNKSYSAITGRPRLEPSRRAR